MSSILLKIVTGAMHLKNNRREAKNMMEEVEKDLHGLGIVKPVHRFEKKNNFFPLTKILVGFMNWLLSIIKWKVIMESIIEIH